MLGPRSWWIERKKKMMQKRERDVELGSIRVKENEKKGLCDFTNMPLPLSSFNFCSKLLRNWYR